MNDPVQFPAGFSNPIKVGDSTVYEPTVEPEPVPEPTPTPTPEPVPTPTPIPTPTPTPTPSPNPNPSGMMMPFTAPTNFPKTVLREDFMQDAPEGQFLNVYGNKFTAYPVPYHDTRGTYRSAPLDFGSYEPRIISVADSMMTMHFRDSADGTRRLVCAPIPYLDPTKALGKYGPASNCRVSIRWRCRTPMPTRKFAWLLWPSVAGTSWPHDGEIDFLEGGLNGTSTAKTFMHRQDATQGDDQASRNSGVPIADGKWHTSTIEWVAGVSFKNWLDGQLQLNETSRVPKHPMRLVIQCETEPINGSGTLQKVDGKVDIDWIVIESK